MRSWRLILAWIALLVTVGMPVRGDETHMTSDDYFTTTCSGIWSKSDIPGGSESFIKVTLENTSQGKTALLIYEWDDFNSIGVFNNNTGQVQYVCDQNALAAKLCDLSQYGGFIIPQDTKNTSIYGAALDLKKNESAQPDIALYKVEHTGYYCVAILPANLENNTSDYFDAFIEWRLPYGNLPASDYPKLLFYGAFSLVYLAVGIFWGIQSYRYWDDILPVQHFLSGAIFYMIVEMAVNWGFWEAYNQTGSPSYALLALVALLNAGRNSMSFFMLLVVCMGFSVVKPSLGSIMTKCVVLACTHFFFGVIYSLGVMLLSPESAGFLVLLAIFPLSMTMSAFYVWIFTSLATTITSLEVRKQHVKATMYKRLHRLLVFSLIMVVIIFILNMFAFSGRNEMDWAARSWKWRWVMLDGLLNLLYFVIFIVIIILWRPTYNNQRYGLQQISQDEEEAIDLENQLRRAEGSHGDQELDDVTAIFEVGDDDLSDDGVHQHKSNPGNSQHSTVPLSQQTPRAAATIRNERMRRHPHSDDEEEEFIDDERAHLTSNART